LTSPEVIELPRAGGTPLENATVVKNATPGTEVQSVIVAADANDGNYGGSCYGLSAVRFVSLAQAVLEPVREITVTASSVYSPDQDVRHLIDGSGMTGRYHDDNQFARTMWHTPGRAAPAPPAAGLAPSPAWVRFDFAHPRTVDAVLIWNHNQAGLTDRGFRRTRIYGSSDGTSWFPMTSSETVELPQSAGGPMCEATSVPNAASGRPVKAVIVAADATDGNYGGSCYGLSAVRFVVKY
jgi:hypothetical protein